MKSKKKQAAKRPFRVPPVVWVLGGLAVVVVVPWLLLSSDAPSPGGLGRTASTTPVWTPLVSQQHGFRVSLPAPAQDLSAGAGFGLSSMWTAMYTGGTFMVQVTPCPEKLCSQAPDNILEGARQGALEGLHGTLLSEKRLELPCPEGTCQGLDFDATGPQGLRVSARILIARGKLFQLLGTQTSGSDEVFRKVVDSFTFL